MPPYGDAVPGAEQYFVERPRSPSERRTLRFLYRGAVLTMTVDRGVFGSSALDPGTALLIGALDPGPRDRVLDLGCGWGPIGIAAARAAPLGRVVLVDTNRRAVALARENLRRNRIENAEARAGNGLEAVEGERFELIVTNPPYHAGRPLLLAWLEGIPSHLELGGRLLLVGKGSQGILYYQDWLRRHWAPEVEVRDRGGGYRVLEARPSEVPPIDPEPPTHRPDRPPARRGRSSPRSS